MPIQHVCPDNRRYYQIGGMTICVASDIPITDRTFHPKFKRFECQGRGKDLIFFRHHFSIPEPDHRHMGKSAYHHPPWMIYRNRENWIYLAGYNEHQAHSIRLMAVFSHDHTEADIHHHPETKKIFREGGMDSLSLMPTDQIILARVLADRQGCILHSSGVILEDKGLLFVGHSDAGKSTLTTLLKPRAEILCDDRIVLRQQLAGCHIYGTWSHGDVAQVSPASAPLKAIFFLKQARSNRLQRLDNRPEIIHSLLACLIKPLVTADWWHSMLTLVSQVAAEVPCYTLEFTRAAGLWSCSGVFSPPIWFGFCFSGKIKHARFLRD